jgi:hypothetical protein
MKFSLETGIFLILEDMAKPQVSASDPGFDHWRQNVSIHF